MVTVFLCAVSGVKKIDCMNSYVIFVVQQDFHQTSLNTTIIDHYPQLIREFGPLTNMWTMRFEVKHSYFKRVVNESHCFKSILTMLAEKKQLLVVYHLSSPTYFTPDLVIPDTTPVGTEILSSSDISISKINLVSVTVLCVTGLFSFLLYFSFEILFRFSFSCQFSNRSYFSFSFCFRFRVYYIDQ